MFATIYTILIISLFFVVFVCLLLAAMNDKQFLDNKELMIRVIIVMACLLIVAGTGIKALFERYSLNAYIICVLLYFFMLLIDVIFNIVKYKKRILDKFYLLCTGGLSILIVSGVAALLTNT